MATARFAHTATLLASGKVLVAGGELNFSATTAGAELYDPTSGTWAPTVRMTAARGGQTATLLADGTVLVAGGISGSGSETDLASAELYHPSTGTWTATGHMAVARDGQTATRLRDGRVLIVGGETCAVVGLDCTIDAGAELYDPSTGTFTPTGSMHDARWEQTATLLPDGKVLVTGGIDQANGSTLASAELYDPATGTWTPTGSMSVGRGNHTATLLPNGTVLVVGDGGASAEVYDPATGRWTPTGSMSIGRRFHTATLLPTGQVLVAGGDSSNGIVLAESELYNPATGTWTVTGSMGTGRFSHTATLLASGHVLVAGGTSPPLAGAELYTPGAGPFVTDGPSSLDFGQIQVGTSAATQTVTITNTGDGPLTVGSAFITGAAGQDFTSATTCLGSPVPPRGELLYRRGLHADRRGQPHGQPPGEQRRPDRAVHRDAEWLWRPRRRGGAQYLVARRQPDHGALRPHGHAPAGWAGAHRRWLRLL
jgi:hypothetical protein